MPRWLALTLGLAVAAGALYVLASGGSAPMGDIDAASRQSLERVLERAESERGR